jgi:hypothetical protein
MWIAVLAAWLLCIRSIQPPLFLVMFDHTTSVLRQVVLLYFICWLDFTWLCGIHQLAVVACSSIRNDAIRHVSTDVAQTSRVAILYTTMNDFSRRAALSCVNQSHPECHVFLLDDSTEPRYQALVDAFHAEHLFTTTIVRRQNRSGFKAGNLNHALQKVGSAYEFFAVCDADGVLPSDFASKTLTHFADEGVGFVQALQQPLREDIDTRFARDLDTEVEIYWRQIVPASERFGFVMFHGHGGMIRTNVWRLAGGFPALVAEDLAFSTRARQNGYRGVIAHDVICYEEFPTSYGSFAKRHLKYTRGACEHFRKEMWPFLLSRNVKWFEKADRLLASLAMLSSLPLLLFVVDCAFLFSGVFFVAGVSPPVFHRGGSIDFSWRFYLAMVGMLITPLTPVICHLWGRPKALVRHLANSVATHLSLVANEAWEIVGFVLLSKNSFPVTGDRGGSPGAVETASRSLRCELACVFLGCTVLPVAAATLFSPSVLPISLATVTGAAIRFFGWEHQIARILIPLPAASVLVIIVFGCPWLAYGALIPLVGSPL